jgi:hypothetical protein
VSAWRHRKSEERRVDLEDGAPPAVDRHLPAREVGDARGHRPTGRRTDREIEAVAARPDGGDLPHLLDGRGRDPGRDAELPEIEVGEREPDRLRALHPREAVREEEERQGLGVLPDLSALIVEHRPPGRREAPPVPGEGEADAQSLDSGLGVELATFRVP